MNRNQRNVLLKRQRGAVILPLPRLDGPVGREVKDGMAKVWSEIRRAFARISITRELRRLEAEEVRAVKDVDWLREDLIEAERNLTRLELDYEVRRRALKNRLKTIGGGAQ